MADIRRNWQEAVANFQECMSNLTQSTHTLLERVVAARNLAQAMLNEEKYDPEYIKLIVELLR